MDPNLKKKQIQNNIFGGGGGGEGGSRQERGEVARGSAFFLLRIQI